MLHAARRLPSVFALGAGVAVGVALQSVPIGLAVGLGLLLLVSIWPQAQGPDQ